MSRYAPTTHEMWMEIERGDELIDVCIEYTIQPVVAATYWQPAEGGDVEIQSVKHGNLALELTDAEERKAYDFIQMHHDYDAYDGPDCDYEYDRRRDEQDAGRTA